MISGDVYVIASIAILIGNLFKSHRRLEAENLLLRHLLHVALRRAPARLRLRGVDRAVLAGLVRLWPDLAHAVQIMRPETVLRWHRMGFRAYWRWKSRKRAGRPKIDRSLRDLIRQMSRDNVLLGRLAHPRGAIEAGFRGRAVDGLEMHGPRAQASVPALEDILAQSCRGDCGRRPVRRSDRDV